MEELIEKLAHEKVYLSVDGSDLKIRFEGDALNPVVIEEIKSNKQRLITYLNKYEANTAYQEIPLLAPDTSYPISSAQKRLWVLCQLEEGLSSYNLPAQIPLNGKIDTHLFGKAIEAVIDRHEILRTVFKENEQGEVRQWILATTQLDFLPKEIDLSQSSNPNEELQEYLSKDFHFPFDIQAGPLLRSWLFKLAEDRYLFHYNIHHLISDAWSREILEKEIFTFYDAFAKGQAPQLPPLRIQYKDYAAWQITQLNSKASQLQKAYWLKQLSGDLPKINLPSTLKRPLVKSNKGHRLETYLSEELTQKIKQFCQQQGGSLFMGFTAAAKSILYKYTGEQDLTIGTLTAGRDHDDLENQIGFYVNTLALRTSIEGSDSFESIFGKVKNTALTSYEHKAYPFDQLTEELDLKRDTSRGVVFDIMIILQNVEAQQKNKTYTAVDPNELIDYGESVSKLDLELVFEPRGDYFSMSITYNTEVYEKAFIVRFLENYKAFLARLLKAPKKSIDTIDSLDPKESRLLLQTFNSTTTAFPEDRNLIELFEDQVAKSADQTALIVKGQRFSFQQLHDESGRIADYLKATYNIAPGDRIAVFLPRNEFLIIALISILKCGAVVIPIDYRTPQERVKYFVEDGQAKLLFDPKVLKAFLAERAKYSANFSSLQSSEDALAYIIYTSGSTARPKGVCLGQRGILNRLHWMWESYPFEQGEVGAMKTSIAFVDHIWELFGFLLQGIPLVLFDEHFHQNIPKFIDQLEQHAVSRIVVVPTLLKQLLDHESAGQQLHHLKYWTTSGEALSAELITHFHHTFDSKVLLNIYGSTEVSADVACYDYSKPKEGQAVLIGKPIANTEIYILDPAGSSLRPLGAVGEICIGGMGLAKGYYNRPEEEVNKFIDHPFKENERLYRSGDLGKWHLDGHLEFIGRQDHQIKIRGNRVELGEIEQALLRHSGIQQAALCLHQPSDQSTTDLLAYISGVTTLNSAALRRYLRTSLPDYMLPNRFILLDQFPLTTTGKINRKMLSPELGQTLATGVRYVAPKDATEKQLIAIVAEGLGRKEEEIGTTDNFFDLGGDSVKMIKILSAINKTFGTELNTVSLFRFPNVKQLCKNAILPKEIKPLEEPETEEDLAESLDDIIDFMND